MMWIQIFLAFELFNTATGLQFMGRALSFDWHFRSHILPPFRETLDLKPERDSQSNENVVVKFVAYGKTWKANLVKNNVLFSNRTHITARDIHGNIKAEYKIQIDCYYYIGSVIGGNTEYGLISMSTCNDKLDGLIITNLNDYIIYELGWKRHRAKRTVNDINIAIKVANTTEYKHSIDDLKQKFEGLHKSHKLNRLKRAYSTDSQVPKFYKLDPPSGRNLYLELGLIVDKHYIKDFSKTISSRREDLIHHILLSYNNAQLWYIHPSFGLQLWLVIKDIVFVEPRDIPLRLDASTVSNPAALCKWVKKTFPEESLWDEVMILSSKPNIWNGRVGLAQRSGVCSSAGTDRCSGISHVNFQLASFARLIAHEAMHPLGVSDDYEGRTSLLCYSGVMRRGVWQDHDWSVCAVQSFEKWAGTSSNTCVSRDGTPTLTKGFVVPNVPVNIAWRASAVQSSTYRSEKEWGAWKATDGPFTGVPKKGQATYGSCTHTLREDLPWLRVDLDTKYSSVPIQAVVIYNRDDCCAERLRDFEVRVGNNADIRLNSLCAYHERSVNGGRNGAAVFTCDRPLSGRYVSVQIMRENAILTVCEVQVMAYIPPIDFSIYDHKCRDHNSFCPYWGQVGECSRKGQESWMMKNCPHTCGKCTRKTPSRYQQAASYESLILPVTSAPDESCEDSHESCMHFAANGDCIIDFDIKKRCPRSCGLCNNTVLHNRKPYRIPTSATTYSTTIKPTEMPTTTIKPTEMPTTTKLTTEPSTRSTTVSPTIITEKQYLKPLTGKKKKKKKQDKRTPPLLDSKGLEGENNTNKPDRAKDEMDNNVLQQKTVGRRRMDTNSDELDSVLSKDGPLIDSDFCEDDSSYCDQWTGRGYCKTSKIVAKLCQKSCGNCKPQASNIKTPKHQSVSVCKDSSRQCKLWLQKSPMSCKNGRITKHCRKTCGMCGSTNASKNSKHTTATNIVTTTTINITAATTTTSPQRTITALPDDVKGSNLEYCEDSSAQCKQWLRKSPTACENGRITKECKMTCGLCTLPTTSEILETTTAKTLQSSVSVPTKEMTSSIQENLALCKDSTRRCKLWLQKRPMACKNGRITKQCKKTCGLCTSSSNLTSDITTPTTPTTTTITTTSKTIWKKIYISPKTFTTSKPTYVSLPVCIDKHRDCRAWSQIGHCKVASVKKLCSRSCGLCFHQSSAVEKADNDDCVDKNKACYDWAYNGFCNKHSVKSNCKQSCGLC